MLITADPDRKRVQKWFRRLCVMLLLSPTYPILHPLARHNLPPNPCTLPSTLILQAQSAIGDPAAAAQLSATPDQGVLAAEKITASYSSKFPSATAPGGELQTVCIQQHCRKRGVWTLCSVVRSSHARYSGWSALAISLPQTFEVLVAGERPRQYLHCCSLFHQQPNCDQLWMQKVAVC